MCTKRKVYNMRAVNEFMRRSREPISEEQVTTANPLMKHIYFCREFKPQEMELLCFLVDNGGKSYSYSEIAKALNHPAEWGTNFAKALKALEKRGYVVITRDHHCYHKYEVSEKFKRMFTV